MSLPKTWNGLHRMRSPLVISQFSKRIASTSTSNRSPQAIFLERTLEEPVIVVNEQDEVAFIGPPDPVSNLRPIVRKIQKHETFLQRRFRETADTTQKWNQEFWAKHNTKFLKEKQSYIKEHTSLEKPTLNADEMSEFYKDFLNRCWKTHVYYNFEWYSKNFALLFLALRICHRSDQFENDKDVMPKNAVHQTMYAIHKCVNSMNQLPCSEHQIIRVTTVPRSNSEVSHPKRPRAKRSLRSKSPMKRIQSPQKQSRNEKVGISDPIEDRYRTSIEKTISCPDNMCCDSSTRTSFTTSRSSIQIDQFARNMNNTDDVIVELRDEIRKVKRQLSHLSLKKSNKTINNATTKIPCLKRSPLNPADGTDKEFVRLKMENRRIKREVELKKQLLDRCKNDLSKANEILTDYELKVTLLHKQAMKSSRSLKKHREQFNTCLKQKENQLIALREVGEMLENLLSEKDKILIDKNSEMRKLHDNLEILKKAYEETNQKCAVLTESNSNLVSSMSILKSKLDDSSSQLETQNTTVHDLERKVCDLNCLCEKLTAKNKKRKEVLLKSNEEEQIKLKSEIQNLSEKLNESEQQLQTMKDIQCRYTELQERISEYDHFSEKYKELEETCKQQYDQLVESEISYAKDKQKMEKLIEDLKSTVDKNQMTLAHMTEINKQQESIIQDKNMALLSKEEQLKLIEKESREFRDKNDQLQNEIMELRKSVSESCSRDGWPSSNDNGSPKINSSSPNDYDETAVKVFSDDDWPDLRTHETLENFELSHQQQRTFHKDVSHPEMNTALDQSDPDFSILFNEMKLTCQHNEQQRDILRNLQDKIANKNKQWNSEMNTMAKEKQKAEYVAKFATQKLLDTIDDFQRQVDAQKKVQVLLTRMVHDKDQQLQHFKAKISEMTSSKKNMCSGKIPMKELFHNLAVETKSDHYTTTSKYSSCSSDCTKAERERYKCEDHI